MDIKTFLYYLIKKEREYGSVDFAADLEILLNNLPQTEEQLAEEIHASVLEEKNRAWEAGEKSVLRELNK